PRVKPPLPFALPDHVFVASFPPEGGKLPPIFEPQIDPANPNLVTLFGSVDAPYTILRFARFHGTCDNNPGQRCASTADCAGGLCVPSCIGNPPTPCGSDGECSVGNGPCGHLFDISPLESAGPIVLPRFLGAGICQDTGLTCSMDCGVD